MAITCTRCSRVNPAEASFCYWDGMVLAGGQGAGGPLQAGSAPFPNQFVFPNGQACRNFDQLALACQQQWQLAVRLLKQGSIGNFLGGMGRLDLAAAAQEAASFPDSERGLDQFLTRLPTQALQPPSLKVEPIEFPLGLVPMGTQRTLQLRLRNAGMRLCYGTLVSDSKWITLGEGQGQDNKIFQFGSETVIPVHLRGQFLRAGNKPLEGNLVLESNGGNLTIPVRAEVPATPFPEGMFAGALAPRQIAEKAKAQPLEAAPLFERGVVARWYASNGWPYPVQGPTVPGIGGVQQFFEALGLAKPPRVELKTPSIFLRGNGGETLQAAIEVAAGERKVVWAYATCDQSWVDVSRWRAGKSATITVIIPRVPNRPNQTLTANIQVTANGNQRFTVPLTVQVGAPSPFGDDMPMPAGPPPMPSGPGRAPLPYLPPLHAVPLPAAPPPMPRGGSGSGHPMPAPMPAVPMHAVPMHAVPVGPGQPMAAIPMLAIPVPGGPPPMHAVPMPGAPYPAPYAPAAPYPPMPGMGPAGPPPMPGRSQGKPWWLHFLPFVFLLLALLGLFLRDLIGTSPRVDDLLDPTPQLVVLFESRPGENTFNFGVSLAAKEGDKPLLSDKYGSKNSHVAKIEGSEKVVGKLGKDDSWGKPGDLGEFRLKEPGPKKESDGKKEADAKKETDAKAGPALRIAEWKFGAENVVLTQKVQIIPGDPVAIPGKEGQFQRQYDTVLVRYLLKNNDENSHKVAFRVVLDTQFGANDSAPLLIPGKDELVHTQTELVESAVPDFVQAQEFPSSDKLGVVLRIGLKPGEKMEGPGRVLLTRHPAFSDGGSKINSFEVPVQNLKKPGGETDSAIVLYWEEKDLKPKEERELGFTFGRGNPTKGDIALSVGGPLQKNGKFTVVAQVAQVKGKEKKVSLLLPKGLRLDKDEKAEKDVPDSFVDPAGRWPNPITWRVVAEQEGRFFLSVKMGDKEQKRPVKIGAAP